MSCDTFVFAAGLGELLPILILILITIISAIAQWLGRINPPARGNPPQRPAANPPRQQEVEDEISEFLRRAAQRRAPQAAPSPQSAPAATRSGELLPSAAPAADQAAEQPVQARVVPEQAVGNEVRQQVEQYLSTSEFTQRSSELGREVAQTDLQLGEHVHEIFDHQVSALASKPGEAAAPPAVEDSPLPEDRLEDMPPVTAAALALQLGDLEGIRQAVVLNEILRRPAERW